MHSDHDVFTNAIKSKKKIKLTFSSNRHGDIEDGLFGPVFYSNSGREGDSGHYYLWDFESITGNHFFGFPAFQILRMEVAEEPFDIVEFFSSRKEISGF